MDGIRQLAEKLACDPVGSVAEIVDDAIAQLPTIEDLRDGSPGHAACLQFLAQLRRLGRFDDALNFIGAALKSNPSSTEIRYEELLSLKYKSNYNEAAERALSLVEENRHHTWRDDQVTQLASIMRLGKYFGESLKFLAENVSSDPNIAFERDASTFFADAFDIQIPTCFDFNSARSLQKAEELTIELIDSAITAGSGFSMIRLGDGEGNILGSALRPGNEAVRRWSAKIISMHILLPAGIHIEQTSTEMAELLARSIQSADVIGLLPRQNLRSSKMPADRQLAGDIFNHLYLASLGHSATTKMYCSSLVATSLNWARDLFEIVSRQKFIGIIGAHRSAAESLGKRFAFDAAAFHQVPIERKIDTPTDYHYPNVFEKITQEIRPPFPGALYLVGAGPLGKYYCHTIKERGGVAVDIGSLMDAIGGLDSTRSWIKRRGATFLRDIGL